MTQRQTPFDQPLEPSAPRHVLTPSAPETPQQLIEPISPPAAPSQPEQQTHPTHVEGTVSERAHPAPPEPTAPPSAPPSVAPELLPHNQQSTAPAPNAPQPGLVPPPSAGREGAGVQERKQPNGTSSSQLSPSPVAQYFPDEHAPAEPDPLHVPGMP